MDKTAEKTRSIRLPEYVWDAFDSDAERCRRSSQKHLEAVIISYLGLEDVEISKKKFETIGELAPHSADSIPFLKQSEIKKKKAG